MVVSTDIVSREDFAAYADGLRAAGLLRRIFLDECHTAITDAVYRTKLYRLNSLYKYECPLIFLTATLPVGMEG